MSHRRRRDDSRVGSRDGRRFRGGTDDFIDRGENVLLKGGSGLGKTTIAQNLGVAALAASYTVRFATLATALADLLGQESVPAVDRRVRRYTRPDLLILDELGDLPCDSRAADILYNIISRRHERASTIITTNLTRLPQFRSLVRSVGKQLQKSPGIRPDTFKVRVFSQEEFDATSCRRSSK